MAIELALRFIKVLVLFVILWTFLWVNKSYGCRRVESQEMAPTYPQDKTLMINPQIRNPGDLERGDGVAYAYEISGKAVKNLVGRVIGLPGDRVKIVKGDVFVNNERLNEGYVNAKNRSSDDYAETLIPRETVFVLGDNRNGARLVDSRTFGPLSAWAIAGKVR